MNRYFWYIMYPFFVSVIIFMLTCVWQPSNMPKLPTSIQWDKVVHFAMFFVLSAASLLYYYKIHREKLNVFKWLFWGFIVPILYGGAIEIIQEKFTRNRSGDFADWAADILGSFVITIFALVWHFKYNRNSATK